MDPNMSNFDPSNIDLANISHFGNGTGGHPSMRENWSNPRENGSLQSDLIRRSGKAIQQFGQMTPPDDYLTPVVKADAATVADESTQSQEDIAKLVRAHRARNAANKRHSNSKKRKGSPLDDAKLEGDEDDDQKTMSVQRAKNRIAAAKCRAKKKAVSEKMQDIHREGARAHNYLRREVRELRDQKAFLLNALLLHEPGVCQCDAVHRLNMALAQQMATGVGGMIPQSMSPSQDSMSSISMSSMVTPSSDMSAARRVSTTENPQSRHPSFTHNMVSDISQAPQFTDFLQNSPCGHAGFS